MNDKKFSDEFLNAFADDQLAPEEKSRVYPLIDQDPVLNRRVCEIRRIRDLIQLAYRNPPAPVPGTTPTAKRRSLFGNRVAAAVLVTGGMMVGWFLNETQLPQKAAHTLEREAAPMLAREGDTAAKGAGPASGADHEMRVLLHLTSGNVANMRDVLDEAENALQFYRGIDKPARVQVVANGEGINLLLRDASPFADRIRHMQREYGNIVFAACKNTLDRLEQDYGIHAQLVPEAVVIDSGVAEIIQLQQQGWAYIQV